MTPIEQAAINLLEELYKRSESDPKAITIRHLGFITKPLEDENKKLKGELLEWQTIGSDKKTQQEIVTLRGENKRLMPTFTKPT